MPAKKTRNSRAFHLLYLLASYHVVPRVRFGRNSYRNLVSCCLECNARKGDRPAPDFLRTLYRLERLTAVELDGRLRALKDLAAGKLRPVLP